MIEDGTDDAAPYLVLADELVTIGDPRGELILLQHRSLGRDRRPEDELKRTPKPTEREVELIAQLAPPLPRFCRISWWCGFVSHARWRLGDPEELVAFLTHPSVRHLGHLEIVTDDDDANMPPAQELLAAAPCARGLRSLEIEQGTMGGLYGDLTFGGLAETLPRLRRLEGSAEWIHLSGRAPPELTKLCLLGEAEGESIVEFIDGAPLMSLEANVTEPELVLEMLVRMERPPVHIALAGEPLVAAPDGLEALARTKLLHLPDAPEAVRAAIRQKIPHAVFGDQ